METVASTPFGERTGALNQTRLWGHWAGYAVAEKYRPDEKVEYFAIRSAVGVFDTSPLYKYRITGSDAERFLSGVLARDVTRCRPGHGQYTMWCDNHGFLIEDGVVLRTGPDEFWLTSVNPNLAYLEGLVTGQSVEIQDSSRDYGVLAVQGPSSRRLIQSISPEAEALAPFDVTETKIERSPVIISRTGYTGDLGYEIWTRSEYATKVWDRLMDAGGGLGILPYGSQAMHMARIEAGLILIDVDYQSSRYAWTDDQRATPIELGYGWMFRNLDRDPRTFVGRSALESELEAKNSRFKLVGLEVDWRHHDQLYRELGLPPAKDHRPIEWEQKLYDNEGESIGFSSSYMYSPVLQRHIAFGRVPPRLAGKGSEVRLEITINHKNYRVGSRVIRLPFLGHDRRVS